MALGMVQAGYGNALYAYAAKVRSEAEFSYDELLAELTTELELALEGDRENLKKDYEEGTDTEEDSEQSKAKADLKDEWEELLEKSEIVEAMLRQMLENGLGQREDAQKESPGKKAKGDMDNEFDISDIPEIAEGRHKDISEYTESPGNSEFLQRNLGGGTEYWSPSQGGRRQVRNMHIFCLTCETECDRKKQWKITE